MKGNMVGNGGGPNSATADKADVRPISGTGKSAKNRAAVGVGTTAQEIKWQDGDDITEITIIATLESGVATTVTNYALVCFDVASGGVSALIGANGTTAIPASLDANQNGFMIPLNTPITFQFENALSYDGTTYVGNMWVRSIDNANQLDIWAGAS